MIIKLEIKVNIDQHGLLPHANSFTAIDFSGAWRPGGCLSAELLRRNKNLEGQQTNTTKINLKRGD
jgi:hypothetical protein